MSEKIIHFERGIPGFPNEKEFILLMQNEDSPFGYLQSVKDEHIAFVVTSPFLFFSDYEFELHPELVARLAIEARDDVVVLAIVTIGEEMSKATANLVAPVVINLKNFTGEQYILEGNHYTPRHLLFSQPSETIGGK